MTFFSSKKKSSKTGVTLTELLVVVAIITIITAIMVINFRAGERGGKLVRSTQLVVLGVRKAQNMAMGSKEVENPQDPPGSGIYEVSKGGYGIEFNRGSADNDYYVIFADFNDDDNRDSPGEDIETVGLEEGIVIDYIFYDPSKARPISARIIFNPLDPLIELRPWIPPADEIYITIRRSEVDCSSPSTCRESGTGCPSGCKVIKLLKAGWVSIIN